MIQKTQLDASTFRSPSVGPLGQVLWITICLVVIFDSLANGASSRVLYDLVPVVGNRFSLGLMHFALILPLIAALGLRQNSSRQVVRFLLAGFVALLILSFFLLRNVNADGWMLGEAFEFRTRTLALLAMFLAALIAGNPPRWVIPLAYAYFGVLAAYSLVFITWRWFSFPSMSGTFSSLYYFRPPSAFGLSLGLFLCWHAGKCVRRRYVIALVGAIAVGTALSLQRSTWVALMMGAVLVGLATLRPIHKRTRLFLAALAVSLAVLLSVVATQALGSALEERYLSYADASGPLVGPLEGEAAATSGASSGAEIFVETRLGNPRSVTWRFTVWNEVLADARLVAPLYLEAPVREFRGAHNGFVEVAWGAGLLPLIIVCAVVLWSFLSSRDWFLRAAIMSGSVYSMFWSFPLWFVVLCAVVARSTLIRRFKARKRA